MLDLRRVAVTGGLSCGKSTVLRLFKDLGAYVVSADEIVRDLLDSQTSLGTQIVDLVGSDVIVNGKIDRSLIAKKVFTQPDLLQSLEMLLHPAVFQEIEKHYEYAKKENKASLFVAEVPLLFEVDGQRFFDITIAVYSDPLVCRERFKLKTGSNENDFVQRMARQMSPEEKSHKANFVIQNNETIDDLRQAVVKVYKEII